MLISNVKVCRVCNTEKPITEFYAQRRVCKPCYKEQLDKAEVGYRADLTFKKDYQTFINSLGLDKPLQEGQFMDVWMAYLTGIHLYAADSLSPHITVLSPNLLTHKAEKFFAETYPNGVDSEGKEFAIKFMFKQGYVWGLKYSTKHRDNERAIKLLRNETLASMIFSLEELKANAEGIKELKELFNKFETQELEIL